MQQIDAMAAFAALGATPDAVLCDVRTEREWRVIGIPDLAALPARLICLPWVLAPGLPPDPHFAEALRAHGIAPHQPVYFICRSGVRSAAAAAAAEAAGFTRCFNVSEGFEGHPGEAGWRDLGLPATCWPIDAASQTQA